MKTLEHEITVSKNDLDDLNHVNNMVYINWILDIAKKHWNNLVDIQTIKKFYWVFLSIKLNILVQHFWKKILKLKLIYTKLRELNQLE
jgi:acyl-CoA thioester hydrolase